MQFSIIIPMYNAASTIVNTIDSCLQQSYKPLEIIVVDDCSTDNSCEIVLDHYINQVQLIKLPFNQGPSAARNFGWDNARGDYVVFVDSDDTFHIDKLRICKTIFESISNIDLLWHDYSILFKSLNSIPDIRKTGIGDLLIRNKVSSSAVLFKRTLPIRFDIHLRYCEDYKIAIQTAYNYQMYRLPAVLTQIGRPVLSTGGHSNQYINMRKGELNVYFSLLKLNPFFIFLLPFLILWSGIKLLRILALRKHK